MKVLKTLYLNTERRSQQGVALLLATFIVLLASIIVLGFTRSSYYTSRTERFVERSVEAEYILKSTLNVGRLLLAQDLTPEDSAKDLGWSYFLNGSEVPTELMFGEPLQGIRLEAEIRPEESKMSLRALVPISAKGANVEWRDTLVRLFSHLGFDEDKKELVSHGPFKGKHFSSPELVSVLIDYMDSDSDSYNPGNFPPGVEGDIEPHLRDKIFANSRIKRIGELEGLPGFTPNRIRKLMPYVTAFGKDKVNINTAPKVVIESLHGDMTSDMVDEIIRFREGDDGPFTFIKQRDLLTPIVGNQIYGEINDRITVGSNWFQILAKADYGTSTYFLRSYVYRYKSGEMPNIRSIELF